MGNIMNKCQRCVLLCIFIALSQPSAVLSKQITIDSEDQLRFALQTMERGQYLRAVGEFERFIHFFPEDEKVPEAYYLVGVCYLRGKKYDSARKVFEEVNKRYSSSAIGGRALFLLGEAYFKEGLFADAEPFFKKVIEAYSHLELKNAALYRMGWNQMKEDKWQEASDTFMRVENSSPLYPSAQDLSRLSLKGEDLSYKNPTSAGIMAGVLPGLGHAYCNRYKDGVVALLLNGITIWAAIEAFDEDLEVLGGILTFLELGWYAGNIYSAVNSAHKHNRKVKNDFRRGLPDLLNLNLFTTRDGHLGMALKIDF